jgi:hypothetical protein
MKVFPKQESQSSLTGRLYGIFRTYADGKTAPTKKDIARATENGFTDGRAK